MPTETVTRVAMRALVDAGQVGELAARMKRKYGWRSSQRAAHQRVLQMLNSGYGEQRHFPADDLETVIELTACKEIEEVLAAARERGERVALQRRIDELEARDERRKMRSVRPDQVESRRTG